MTYSEYRETYSWQAAIALGPKIIQLAEQLPSSEQMGLGLVLREAMVELPAAIGRDLVRNTSTRTDAALKLTAVFELIEQIYPALDGGEVHAALEALVTRLDGSSFDERVAAKLPPAAEASEVAETAPEAVSVLEPAPAPAAAPTPVSVPLTPPPAAPAITVTPNVSTTEQAPDVHPDSV